MMTKVPIRPPVRLTGANLERHGSGRLGRPLLWYVGREDQHAGQACPHPASRCAHRRSPRRGLRQRAGTTLRALGRARRRASSSALQRPAARPARRPRSQPRQARRTSRRPLRAARRLGRAGGRGPARRAAKTPSADRLSARSGAAPVRPRRSPGRPRLPRRAPRAPPRLGAAARRWRCGSSATEQQAVASCKQIIQAQPTISAERQGQARSDLRARLSAATRPRFWKADQEICVKLIDDTMPPGACAGTGARRLQARSSSAPRARLGTCPPRMT